MGDKEQNSIAELSVGDLLKTLSVKQLWTIAGCMLALLIGAFYFGSWVSSTLQQTKQLKIEAEIVRQESEITQLNSELSKVRSDSDFLDKKLYVVSLILKYNRAEAEYFEILNDPEKDDGVFLEKNEIWKNLGDELFDYVMGLEKESKSGVSTSIRLGKGIAAQSITFVEDGSVWPLPEKLFAVAK